MDYEFDPPKNKINLQKHGLSLTEGESVLSDPLLLSMEDEFVEGEQRFVGIGCNAYGELRVIVYTCRGEDIVRGISLRKPESAEVRAYEKGI